MASNRVTEGLESRGDPVEQRAVLRGYVSTLRPAPTNFPEPGSEANLLWVVAPGYSLDRPLGPCWWNADHGATLPEQGDTVVVNFDNEGIPTVVSWEASRTPEPQPSLVSTLPSEPTDGQEIYFQNTAMGEKGIVWHLRFRTASLEHKWEFVGGSGISAGPLGNITTASSSFVALTSGPTLTLPLAGDYRTEFVLEATSNGAGSNVMLGRFFLAGAETPMGAINIVSAAGLGGDLSLFGPITGVTAGQELTVRVRSASALSTTFANARVSAVPVRVG